jgi:hypothetical protein
MSNDKGARGPDLSHNVSQGRQDIQTTGSSWLHNLWQVLKTVQARLRFIAILAVVGGAIVYWDTLRAHTKSGPALSWVNRSPRIRTPNTGARCTPRSSGIIPTSARSAACRSRNGGKAKADLRRKLCRRGSSAACSLLPTASRRQGFRRLKSSTSRSSRKSRQWASWSSTKENSPGLPCGPRERADRKSSS